MADKLFDTEVTHVVAEPGDRRAMCGVRDPMPRVWRKFVKAHQRGYGAVVCPDCASHLE